MKNGEGKTEHKTRSQVLVNSPGWFMINNKDWKLKRDSVLPQIRFTEWLRRWKLKIRNLAASSKTSSKLLNIVGIVTLNAQSAVLLAVGQMIIGLCFMGYLANPAFTTAFGEKFSHRCQVLRWLTTMSPKEFLIEKTCGRSWHCDLACKNIQQYQRSNKQPMSYP